MGFALGRDLLSGRVPIRENCGRCVEIVEASGQAGRYLRSIEGS
jgi:hypothetical protein